MTYIWSIEVVLYSILAFPALFSGVDPWISFPPGWSLQFFPQATATPYASADVREETPDGQRLSFKYGLAEPKGGHLWSKLLFGILVFMHSGSPPQIYVILDYTESLSFCVEIWYSV